MEDPSMKRPPPPHGQVTSAGLPVGETFQESLQFLMRHPKMLGVCAAAHAVYGMVLHGLYRSPQRKLGGNLDDVVTGLLALGLLGVLTAVFSTAAEVILIRYMGDQLRGQERSAGDTVRAALPRLLPGLGSNLLVGLGVGVGTLLFIVPGVLLAVSLSLALPAVVLREAGVFESLSTSWARTKSHFLDLFLLLLICGVITLAACLVAAFFNILATQMSETGGWIAAMVGQAVWGLSLCLILSVLVFSDSKLSGPWTRTREPR